MRCRKIISPKSAYVLVFRNVGDNQIFKEVISPADLEPGAVAIHMNGDRLCGNPVATFRLDTVKSLGLSNDCDLSFLGMA